MRDMLSKVKAIIKLRRPRRLSPQRTISPDQQIELDLKPVEEFLPSNQQRSKKNEEDITVVWLSKNAKNDSFIASLRSIIDYIQVFNNEEAALEYIEFIFEEKLILIIDYFSDHLLTALKALKQVDAVFLYTSSPMDELPSCITAVCSTDQQLFDEINHTCQQLNKQLAVFSIYNQKNKEKHNLTGAAHGSFFFFQLFKAAFKNLPKNSESKNLLVVKCREYYAGNTKVLEEINDFELHYKSNEALQWYRYNSFIYRLVSKALRTENINSLCSFQFYIGDLSKQLEKEFLKFRKQNSKSIVTFYRSLKTTTEEIRTFQHSIGNLILTNGYLSTTRDRQTAYDYVTKLNTQSDEEKVLFEYTVDLNMVKSIVFADHPSYNTSTEENKNVLFDIGTAFKINSCTFNEKEKLWIVNVSGTDEGTDVASEYIEYQKTKMSESNIILMLGHLLIEIGDYDRAEKYFDAILHSSIPNDEEISCIYYNMGRIYRLKGEYDRALDYLDQAYVTHSTARPARLVSAAKALNAIGIVCREQNNVQRAIDSFESALKIYGKTIQGYHPDVAGTLTNLGNIYCEQELFINALTCFNRAQHIFECNLPPNHPNRAILLNNIGNLHYQQSKFDLALDNYQRALTIFEKILPPNHPDILRNRHNLVKVYTMLGEQNQPKMELTHATEYGLCMVNPFIESIETDRSLWDTMDTPKTSKTNMEFIEMKTY